ncbi:MPRGB protein, partial [Brachypodius atriceps]|nr:MPRGB protein [Brachypodius atriceps]
YREPGILSGYRPPRSSVSECLLSIFQMNNETLNIWTHLVPAGYFLWLFLAHLRDLGAEPGAGPLVLYLGTCALYPLASGTAHTLGALGGAGRHRAYCCDYTALSAYGLGSALAYSAYSFPLEWLGSTFHGFYLPVAVLNSALSTGLSCYSRFLEAERPRLSKASRTLAFVYPYIFDSIPIFYRVQHSKPILGMWNPPGPAQHPRNFHGISMESSGFSVAGHSHQLFHVCGILGTLFQLEAISMDMAERRGRLPLPSSLETFGSLGMGAAASLAILGICFRNLRPEPHSR